MGNRKIDFNTLRLLYVHSGNQCAFDGCCSPIFEDDGTLTGECCHIEAFSMKGPRYNGNQSDEERNGYDNLILMCARHHKLVDRNPEKYSVETLKKMKKRHESQFNAKHLEVTDMMMRQLQVDSEQYWENLRLIGVEDKTGLKMELGKCDISSLMGEVGEVYKTLYDNIERIIDSLENLEKDLKSECDKCGVDYSLFNKIPYYTNSLKNRDWELIKLGIPNCMTMLELRFLQLCVMMLERIVRYERKERDMKLLEMCKKRLEMVHEEAFYID